MSVSHWLVIFVGNIFTAIFICHKEQWEWDPVSQWDHLYICQNAWTYSYIIPIACWRVERSRSRTRSAGVRGWPSSSILRLIFNEFAKQLHSRTSRPAFPRGSVSWCGVVWNISSDYVGNKRIFVQEFPGGTMISAHPQRTGISCYTQRTLISVAWNTDHLNSSEGTGVFGPSVAWILHVLVHVCTQAWVRKYICVCAGVCAVKKTPKASFALLLNTPLCIPALTFTKHVLT